MTTQYQDLRADIKALRTDLISYHEAVVKIATQCESCRPVVQAHDLILHGRPGNGHSPGMDTRVASLEASRSSLMRWSRASWAAIVTIVGAVLGWALGR